jgi:hypothetical protein
VTFTNWPDEYIHSSDDDLWGIDRTQLQRNGVAVAAAALYLANLNESDAPTLVAVMAGEARERISHDLATGLSMMARAPSTASGDERRAAYKDALNLLEHAQLREAAGLESVRRFVGGDISKLLDSLVEDLKLTEINHRQRIEEWFHALGGRKSPTPMTDKEKDVSSKVPKVFGSVGEFLRHKENISGPKGLHPLMKFEALNYVDGKRSILDIYRALRAESLSAGEWYYGTVKLEDVEELFKAAEKEKAVEFTTKTN